MLARTPHLPRWPAGPRYDLLEVAIVLGSGAVLLYICQRVESAAGSWLTEPGQYAAAYALAGAAILGAALAGYDRVRAATITLCLIGVIWAVVLAAGTILGGFLPGSTWVAIVYGFAAQWSRKTYDRHRHEQACSHPTRPPAGRG